MQKPARYIGCEDGASRPDHGPGKVAWLLVYPDTYEIGLPNQGLQILYEILNERDDAVAERSYAPWVDLEALLRAHGLPLFSVDTHRPAAEFDLLAFNLSAELVYTNVLNCIDLAGVPVRAAERRPEHPLIGAGGHCTYNPEPLADFVDFFVHRRRRGGRSARSPRSCGEWKAAGAPRAPASRCCGRWPRSRASTCRRCTRSPTTAPRLVAVTPRYPDVPERVEKRTIADLADWPYPKHQLVPLTEVVHDRLNVEVFRGCTRGCRFCQAGHDHPPGPGAARRAGAHDGARRPAAHRLRRGQPHVAVDRRLLAASSGSVADTVNDPTGCGQVSVSPAVACGSTPSPSASPPRSQKARRTGLTFAPEAGTWRMRQVINKLIREEDLYGAVDVGLLARAGGG